MIVDKTVRRNIRLQSTLFIVLFLSMMALLAWLSQLYSVSIDLSKNERNSLAPESIRLVKSIQTPLTVTLFATPGNETGDMVKRLLQRYQYQQPLIAIEVLNPDLYPQLLRQHNISQDAEILIEYQGRSEKISLATETRVTSSMQRLMRQGERWLVFLQGHGERNPYSEANHDLGDFAARLANAGYSIENLNLIQVGAIPQNTGVLVIASPQAALLPGEVNLIKTYVRQGGNLLWLADPGSVISPLDQLADALAIKFLPGVIVDPGSQLLGLDRVDFALVAQYPRHPITQNVQSPSLYPRAQAVAYASGAKQWRPVNFLVSGAASWNETGEIKGRIFNGDNTGELKGPLNIGVALTAAVETESGGARQRIAVLGDADFLSNNYLGNGANLELGLNLFNWLSNDDSLISISPRAAPDTRLELSQNQQIAIAMLFLIIIPLTLAGCGLGIWLKRRKRY